MMKFAIARGEPGLLLSILCNRREGGVGCVGWVLVGYVGYRGYVRLSGVETE